MGHEAKRLALSVRVLVHDGATQSLLTLLGKKSDLFFSTARPRNEKSIVAYQGLIGMAMVPGQPAEYFAPLDDAIPPSPPRWVDFTEWWDEVVFVDNQQRTVTRSQLVKYISNKDGGAHVDPVLQSVYADLSRDNSLGWVSTSNGEEAPLDSPHLVVMRQIAHEMLRTLAPDMPQQKPNVPENAMLAFGVEAVVTEPAHPKVPKVGRNEPCPCGSGKKYKRCALALSR